MKVKYIYKALLLIMVLVATSCSTTRRVHTDETFGGLSNDEYIQRMIENTPEWSVFGARASISLASENGKRTKVRGVLNIKRDETIRLSVAPLLGIEFFRLEISPSHILVVDRLNKRYMRCSLVELSGLINVEVTYHALQSLFLNELFTMDKHHSLKVSDYRKFKVHQYYDETVIEPVRNQKIDFKFYTNVENGRLEKTLFGVKRFRLNWNYEDFSRVDNKDFPHTMTISSDGRGSLPMVKLNLSGISIDGKWNAETKIPSRYQEVNLSELVKMFLEK